MSGPSAGPPQTRPPDVDTGFWLWLAALPVMTIGFLINVLTSPGIGGLSALYPLIGLIAVLAGALVATFLILLRSGYRWARTILTGGGVAAVVYAVTGVLSLDQTEQPPAVAVGCAVSWIVGSVLIAGGTFLLHRGDAQAYLTR